MIFLFCFLFLDYEVIVSFPLAWLFACVLEIILEIAIHRLYLLIINGFLSVLRQYRNFKGHGHSTFPIPNLSDIVVMCFKSHVPLCGTVLT